MLKQPEVKFMGHVITNQGLKPDPDKVHAVDEIPRPTCKKVLGTLLGFMNYLSKFLPQLAEVTQPFCELTAKDAPFLWSPHHGSAFANIKQLVADHPGLTFYDPGTEVTPQYDASKYGLGATLVLPCCLRRMLLSLLRYNIDVICKKAT